MKEFNSALSLPILLLALLVLFTGCAGLSANPSANPAPTSAAHGTFVFVSGFDGNAQQTNGFRLSPDGTLTPIPGSPFPIAGDLVVSGSFLIGRGGKGLTSYRVDPGNGRPVPVDSVAIPSAGVMAADAKNVYVNGSTSNFDSVIYGFRVGPSGALTPLPGAPYMYAQGCGGNPDIMCPMPTLGRMALNDTFFAVAEIGFHDSGGLVVISRESSGALQGVHKVGFSDQDRVALPHPGGNIVFSSNSMSTAGLTSYSLDPSGNPTAVTSFPINSGITDEAVDPTGKFLFGVDGNGAVHVFTLDSATATFGHIGASEPAGDGADLMAIDPSGRFVIVAQSSNLALSAPPDQITVFTFDPVSGAMKKLQSYPVGKFPGRIAIVAE
jgi:6-phosphogluconolactonase (cycloisomerase 2 family)